MLRNYSTLVIVALTAGIASAQHIPARPATYQPLRAAAASPSGAGRVYELRTYFASPGKLDDLHARFKNHTLRLHERYDIENVGYWVPTDNPKRTIVSLVSYPSMAARERSWSRLMADREWIQVRRDSEANGRILDTVREEILTADEAVTVKALALKEANGFEIRRFTEESGKADDVKAAVHDELSREYGAEQTRVHFFTPTGEGNRTSATLIAIVVRPAPEVKDDVKPVSLRTGNSGGLAAAKIPGAVVTNLKPTEYSPVK